MITVNIPASKSLTHRAMIAAALAKGTSCLRNVLDCDDTRYTRQCLETLGASFIDKGKDVWITGGKNSSFPPSQLPLLHVGDSGTTARLLGAVCTAFRGAVLDGSSQMRGRPFADMEKALSNQGIKFHWLKRAGYLPCRIESSGLPGGKVLVRTDKSSQFLSGLLMAAPLARKTIILPIKNPVSWPYVELTVSTMADFGISVRKIYPDTKQMFSSPRALIVEPQPYNACHYEIENDWSAAAFFCVAGVIGKKPVCLRGLLQNSLQADAAIVPLLKQMGAKIEIKKKEITLLPSELIGIEADMKSRPDIVPALAVAAACAKTKSKLKNLSHLRYKESDRITSVADALSLVGVKAEISENSLTIEPCSEFKQGAIHIPTRNDHRIAMSMSLFRLVGCEIHVDSPQCVKKSFPEFWQEWKKYGNNVP